MNEIVETPRAARSRRRQEQRTEAESIMERGRACSHSSHGSFLRSIDPDDGLSLDKWLEKTKEERFEEFDRKRENEPLTEIEKRNVRELGNRDLFPTPIGFNVFVPLPFPKDQLGDREEEIEQEKHDLKEKKAMLRLVRKTMTCQSQLLGVRSAVTDPEHRRLLKSDELRDRAKEEVENLQEEMIILQKIIDQSQIRIERAEALLAHDKKEVLEDQEFNNSMIQPYDDYEGYATDTESITPEE